MLNLMLKNLPDNLSSLTSNDIESLSDQALSKLKTMLNDVDASGHVGLMNEIEHVQKRDIHLANFSTILGHASQIPNRTLSRGLDVGCSFGLKTVMLRYFGFGHISGSDVANSLIDGANLWSRQVGLADMQFQLNKVDGLPFGQETFDWVTTMGLYANLSTSATTGLFADCFRVLKPGGVLLFHDSANPRVPSMNKQICDYHQLVEIGTGTAERPQGSAYLERVAYLRASYPNIDEVTSAEIARNTCYFGKREIAVAVASYQAGNGLPGSSFAYGDPLIHPIRITGETPCRRATDPKVIKSELMAAGFSRVIFRKPVLGGTIPDEAFDDYYSRFPGVFITAMKG
jgi:SAM-dependent methyltransferase